MADPAYEDAFNLLCDRKLGNGIHRNVFTNRLDKKTVVKVEIEEDWRSFANVRESKFWTDNQHYNAVAKWLAPCEFLSPDGRVLIQRRCEPLRDSDKLPTMLPAFLADIKRENFGWLDGRIVCFDYAITIENPSVRMKKADW